MSDSSDPMDCSLPGSSIHGIFQAKVLEWDAIAFSEEQAERERKAEREKKTKPEAQRKQERDTVMEGRTAHRERELPEQEGFPPSPKCGGRERPRQLLSWS